jgi:hypothetical protein
MAFPYKMNNPEADLPFRQRPSAMRLVCLDGRLVHCRSNIYGFRIKTQDIEEIRRMTSETPILFPGSSSLLHILAQSPTHAGLSCATSAPLRNCYNIAVLFPRTGNEITCCKNPGLQSLQLGIDGTMTPDKQFSSIDTMHTELMLTNGYLASLFSASPEMIESLVNFELYSGVYYYGIPSKINPNTTDNTSYCFNVATARLCPGVFTDGYFSDGGNANISLNGTHLISNHYNPYLYPIQNTNRQINTFGPALVIISVILLSCSPDGVRVISGDDIRRVTGEL